MTTGRRATAILRLAAQKAVDRLSSDLRITVVLRYTEELSYDQIAAALGCAPGTVASRLNRAHKILHRRLAHLGQREDFRLRKLSKHDREALDRERKCEAPRPSITMQEM